MWEQFIDDWASTRSSAPDKDAGKSEKETQPKK